MNEEPWENAKQAESRIMSGVGVLVDLFRRLITMHEKIIYVTFSVLNSVGIK